MSEPTHKIVDAWRDCVVVCSCGWRTADPTMKAARRWWRLHKLSEHKPVRRKASA